MKSILRNLKRYWWGVFLILLGVYMVVATIVNTARLIAGDTFGYEDELSRLIVDWGMVSVSTVVWLIGGAFILAAGISRTRKKLKAGREEVR